MDTLRGDTSDTHSSEVMGIWFKADIGHVRVDLPQQRL